MSQLRFPRMGGGANKVSLIEGQRNFDKFGAGELRFLSNVRKPRPEDKRDSEWKPIDANKDNIEDPVSGTEYGETYPSDLTVLYYWRRTYWRR